MNAASRVGQPQAPTPPEPRARRGAVVASSDLAARASRFIAARGGLVRAAEALGVNRETLLRIVSREGVRRATLAIVELRIPSDVR